MQTKSDEKWRTIPEFTDYVISNHGRIANKAGTLKKSGEHVKLHRAGYGVRKSVKKLMKEIWK